jgi:hypothetical protein
MLIHNSKSGDSSADPQNIEDFAPGYEIAARFSACGKFVT